MGPFANKLTSRIIIASTVVSLFVGMGPFSSRSYAATLLLRSMEISNNQAATTNVLYNTSFFVVTPGTLGSVEIQFCSNSPLQNDVCDIPTGFDISNTTINSQSGETGFTVSTNSTANDLILTRPPTAAVIGMTNYVLGGVTNPGVGGALFARILTYPTSDASGPPTDFGGIALSIEGSLSISTEVPPFLTFCIGESISGTDCTTATDPFSDLGDLSTGVTSAAQDQMVVATNAGNGYELSYTGPTMTSGNNTIHAMTARGPSLVGTDQFGMNLRANQTPVIGQDPQGTGAAAITANYDQPNRFYFNPGDVIAASPSSDAYRKFTVSYIVNISKSLPGGVYSTTLTYVALANF